MGGRVGGKSKTISTLHRSKQRALHIDPVALLGEERLRAELHTVAEGLKP